MSLLFIIVIAVSLSMDAFSLSLAYGTLDIQKRDRFILSLIVGIYHFFMPLIGLFIGSKIIAILPINPNTVVFVVLSFIGIQMIIESKKETVVEKKLKFKEKLLFGLAVSLDSFSVGIGLNQIYSNIYIADFIFSLSSFLFTFLGLFLGTAVHNLVGKISTLIGGITLIIIGVTYIL